MQQFNVGDKVYWFRDAGLMKKKTYGNVIYQHRNWVLVAGGTGMFTDQRPTIRSVGQLYRITEEPIKVGDQVECGELAVITGRVLCIDEGIAWIKPDRAMCDSRVPFTCEVGHLRSGRELLRAGDRVRSNDYGGITGVILCLYGGKAWVQTDDSERNQPLTMDYDALERTR